MLLRHLSLLPLLLQLVLEDSGASTGDDTDATGDRDGAGDTQDAGADTEALGDKGKAALAAERKARKDAETARKQAESELATLKREAQERADAEAKEQGKWQELAEQREADLSTVTAERDTYKAQLDEALAAITADIDATWKDIPEEVRELYEGDDDDVLAKRKHLTRSAKLIQRLTEAAEEGRGNRPNPKPTDRKTTTDQDNRARAAMRPRM